MEKMVECVRLLSFCLYFSLSNGFNLRQEGYPSAPFDLTIANASVWLCSTTYCDPDSYSTYPFNGPLEGLVYYQDFHDLKTDMRGYLSYQPPTKQIWIVYRGSDSTRNWIADMESLPVNAGISDCFSCKVHAGFKTCNDNTISAVSDGVKQLYAMYPDYRLIITGHSLGAAVATLAAVSLRNMAYDPTIYAVASPRVGNPAFSNYVATLLSGDRAPQRLTHFKDTVPHMPTSSMGYEHVSAEVYEDESHILHSCVGSEDSACGEQWKLYQTNVEDHMLYLNHNMSCNYY